MSNIKYSESVGISPGLTKRYIKRFHSNWFFYNKILNKQAWCAAQDANCDLGHNTKLFIHCLAWYVLLYIFSNSKTFLDVFWWVLEIFLPIQNILYCSFICHRRLFRIFCINIPPFHVQSVSIKISLVCPIYLLSTWIECKVSHSIEVQRTAPKLMPYTKIKQHTLNFNTVRQNLTLYNKFSPFTKLPDYTPNAIIETEHDIQKFSTVHQTWVHQAPTASAKNQSRTRKSRTVHQNSTPFSESQCRMPKFNAMHKNPGPYTKIQRRSASPNAVCRNSTPYTEIQDRTPNFNTVQRVPTPYAKIQCHTRKSSAVHRISTPFSESQCCMPKFNAIHRNPGPYTEFQRRSASPNTVCRNSVP